jgi:alkylation response protein AidB-like acyl-CoA dehydrogenase
MARFPESAVALRAEVRAFLDEERRAGAFEPGIDTWLSGVAPEFSRKLGSRGWLGMTWPAAYGGQERSALERFLVIEELLAAGAPVGAHWIADRQSGPALLRYATEEQRQRLLPPICRGESYWAVGMSEADSGSDLASVRTRAERTTGGWRVNGAKLWTSGAHVCHYMTTLCRTAAFESDRHAGLSQLIVELSADGVTIRPIQLVTGAYDFNEVVLEDVFVPDEMVLGEIGQGWQQVTAELAYERSGPERFLSVLQLLVEFTRWTAESGDSRSVATLGQLCAELWSLRQLSTQIAAALDAGMDVDVHAALVKDVGTRFEQASIEAVRRASPDAADPSGRLGHLLMQAVTHGPGFTLRGGTNEILKGVVARGLGL